MPTGGMDLGRYYGENARYYVSMSGLSALLMIAVETLAEPRHLRATGDPAAGAEPRDGRAALPAGHGADPALPSRAGAHAGGGAGGAVVPHPAGLHGGRSVEDPTLIPSRTP